MNKEEMTKMLDNIKDEDTKALLLSLLETQEKMSGELNTARETSAKLVEDNKRLQAVNTDLYARTVSGYVENDKKEKEDEPIITFNEVAENLGNTLRKGK